MQYIGSNIRFIFTKIKELLNSHNTDNSAHSELFKSWKRLRNPNNADIADALAATYKNGIGDVLVEVKDDTTFALEDIKLFFRPASFKLISANDSLYEGIYITMDGTQGRYVAKTFADSEIMTPEGPSTISTPSELALYPAASDAVLYTPQTLTEEQKSQARTNIGALDENIKTTPVDIDVTLFGRGENIVYVKDGWLRPCPTDADNELILHYRRVFGFIGLPYTEPNSQNILLEAKSAYALYQKGLASESIKVTNNPLRAAQVYVKWNLTTRSNKHYFYYTQVATAYKYDCTYCVEDDALTSEIYQCPIYSTSTGVGNQTKVSQFRMSAAPTEDMHIATKQYVDTAKTEAQQLGLTTATPGKTIKVKTVQDGKPTEWEVADIYEKPDTGIPKTDLAEDVQTSLAKADTSISYDSQTLTEAQQAQARANIGAGQPVFVVNVTGTVDNNYTADKTAAEIEAAYQAGRTIVCRIRRRFEGGGIPVELALVSRNQERVFIFYADQLDWTELYTLSVRISDSGVEVGSGMVEIYEQPDTGIPKTDLEQSVQTSLDKADTAISYNSQTLTEEQQEQARENINAWEAYNGAVPHQYYCPGYSPGDIFNFTLYIQDGMLTQYTADASDEVKTAFQTLFLTPNSSALPISAAKSMGILVKNGLMSVPCTWFNDVMQKFERRVTRYGDGKIGFKEFNRSSGYNGSAVYNYLTNEYISQSGYFPIQAYGSSTQQDGVATVRQFSMASEPTQTMHIATKKYVDTAKTEAQQLGLTTATPGKTIKVKTVQDGKPTEWEVADIYEKPDTGIPKTDLAADIQKTLTNANEITKTGVGLIRYIKMVDADTTGSGIVVPDNSDETYYTIKDYINSDYTVILLYKGVPYSLNYTKLVNNSISLYYFHAIVSSDPTSTVDTASEIKTVMAGNNLQFKVTTKPLYISATVSNNTLIIR